MESRETRGNAEKSAEMRGNWMQHEMRHEMTSFPSQITDFVRYYLDARQGFEP
jgi:hypothetical protein